MQAPAHPTLIEAFRYNFFFHQNHIVLPALLRELAPPWQRLTFFCFFFISQLKRVSIALFRTLTSTRARSSRLKGVVHTRTDRTIQVIKVCEKCYPCVFFSCFTGSIWLNITSTSRSYLLLFSCHSKFCTFCDCWKQKNEKSYKLHHQSREKRFDLCFPCCFFLLTVFTPWQPNASCSLNDTTSVDFLKQFSKWLKIVPFYLPDVHSVAILKSDTHFSLIPLPHFSLRNWFISTGHNVAQFSFRHFSFFLHLLLSPLTAVSMGPICAHY